MSSVSGLDIPAQQPTSVVAAVALRGNLGRGCCSAIRMSICLTAHGLQDERLYSFGDSVMADVVEDTLAQLITGFQTTPNKRKYIEDFLADTDARISADLAHRGVEVVYLERIPAP